MKTVHDSDLIVIPKPQGQGESARTPPLEELEFIARLMDGVFHVPGTQLKFGLDAILGLIPGLGDTISSVVSLYILRAAQRHGVSRVTLTRMGANVALDYAVGIIPVLGDAFDVYWGANQKNVELLRRHLEENPVEKRRAKKDDWLFFAGLVGILLVLLVGSLAIAWFFVAAVMRLAFG